MACFCDACSCVVVYCWHAGFFHRTDVGSPSKCDCVKQVQDVIAILLDT